MDETELVIFDCDGVLIDSEVISARMLIAELAEHGVEIDIAYVARHFLGRSYPVVLAQVRAEFGIDLPEGFEADYRARLFEAFARDLTIMPGVVEVIESLGVPYWLATSSTPARLAHSLKLTGLSPLFEGRSSTASEVARGKPAPDLFDHVARITGADPARCLVIEDSLAGIAAARAAGMPVWRFTGGSHFEGLGVDALSGQGEARTFAKFSEFFHFAPALRRTDLG